MADVDPIKLILSLDEAAEHLLRHVGEHDSLFDEKPSLADKVRAFDAVASWAKIRMGVIPEVKKESPFDILRQSLSAPAPRRGSPRKKQAKPEPDSSDEIGTFNA